MALQATFKNLAGNAVATIVPKYRYENLIVMIGHMRSGSTALSNIICEHKHISGYGEAHITYMGRKSLGILALSNMRRGTLKPSAKFQYDKILHNRYDLHFDSGLLDAKAIFLTREPKRTLPSILRLFSRKNTGEYSTIDACADYYAERMEAVLERWHRYPDNRRLAISYDDLVADPDVEIARVSSMLGLEEPLQNKYTSRAASVRANAGDPVNSVKFNSITAVRSESDEAVQPLTELGLPSDKADHLESLFLDFSRLLLRS